MGQLEPIIDGVIRKVKQWTYTNELLIQNASIGDTQLKVRSARRFQKGDEFLIRDENGDKIENSHLVDSVIDDTTLLIQRPIQFSWTTSEKAFITRTFNGNFVKAVYYGEPDIIALNELPAITVNGTTSNSEWLTVRATKERYEIDIAVYVSSDTQESGSRVLSRITDTIEKGLKQNLYPLSNDFTTVSLIADAAAGDQFIKIADTSILAGKSIIMLENEHETQEFMIKCVSDGQTVQLANSLYFNFPISLTSVIIPNRFLFNSWPGSINYGKILKGTLLKASVISFFVEEVEDQFVTSYYDTQLR